MAPEIISTVPINMIQSILIALLYYISASTWLFQLGMVFAKPLFMGLIVGIIMGNPVLGAQMGAAINLVYIGNITAGGAASADPALAGILGTALAMASGLEAHQALLIALPLGLAGQFITVFHMTFNATFAHGAINKALEGDRKGMFIYTVALPQLLQFATRFTIVFVACRFGASAVVSAVDKLPTWLLAGLNTMGGMMPAIGIALNLNVIARKESMPFFLLGFICVKYFALSNIVVAVIAGIVAYIAVVGTGVHGQNEKLADISLGEAVVRELDRPLKKSTVRKAHATWMAFAHSCYNYEMLQGVNFCYAMSGPLAELYDTKEELGRELEKHCVFFNTDPWMGAMVPALTIAMEEERANGSDISPEAINAVKSGLMGPLAGVGDTVKQGIYQPLFLSIGIGMVEDGAYIFGPIVFAVLNTLALLVLTFGSWHIGYKFGRATIERLLEGGLMQMIMGAAGIVGCMVVGSMSAAFVNIFTPLEWVLIPATEEEGSKALTINLQTDFFDRLFLGLLPLSFTLICYRLFRKGISTIKVLLFMVVFGLVTGAFGIFTNALPKK